MRISGRKVRTLATNRTCWCDSRLTFLAGMRGSYRKRGMDGPVVQVSVPVVQTSVPVVQTSMPVASGIFGPDLTGSRVYLGSGPGYPERATRLFRTSGAVFSIRSFPFELLFRSLTRSRAEVRASTGPGVARDRARPLGRALRGWLFTRVRARSLHGGFAISSE